VVFILSMQADGFDGAVRGGRRQGRDLTAEHSRVEVGRVGSAVGPW
jgi:hypothetical protein